MSFDAMQRLIKRVLDGDVVFFVGSGFSVDSERNTAKRLMLRLLIRLTAMAKVLGEDAEKVRADLGSTFGIEAKQSTEFPYSDAEVTRLSDRYYETNDWFVSAYARLLALLSRTPADERTSVVEKISETEERLRTSGGAETPQLDAIAFEPIHLGLVQLGESGADGWRTAGKALFLDTMGFRNTGIMSGEPHLEGPDDVSASFGDRLLPRHQVIARLAREGFCTTTITTNYDRLLEGAFRLAGFGGDFYIDGLEEARRVDGFNNRRFESFSPETYFNDFACIASPREFFTEGKAHRTAVVMKIHGCSQRYRMIPHTEPQALSSYLRSMVFTYREIQNWREDSWAADYLRSLLRTRTVVFCGYSLQDPVIHDTFRTVYEEMARDRGPDGCACPCTKKTDVPAFFFAPGVGNNEFYGMEVLRAASAAVGEAQEPLSMHPNYIRFNFRTKPEFPHLDELFRWLFHGVFRERQKQCLESELHQVVTSLFGRPRPDGELESIRKQFSDLYDREVEEAGSWDNSERSRQSHAAICSWTDGFHNALLREFACAAHAAKHSGETRTLALMRQISWHYPTSGRPAWTCWGAVLELALRRMIAAALGPGHPAKISGASPLGRSHQEMSGANASPAGRSHQEMSGANASPLGRSHQDWWLVRGGSSEHPTILFPSGADTALQSLTIAAERRYRRGRMTRIDDGTVRQIFWDLPLDVALWPVSERSGNPPGKERDELRASSLDIGLYSQRAPDAQLIWRWALGAATSPHDLTMARKLLAFRQHVDTAKAKGVTA